MPMLDARTTNGAHEAAVARLRAAYAAVPPGAPVRLAKRTSNLFRFREASGGTGPALLDVSAFGHVLSVDPVARTARVGGMTTYEDLCDATLPHQLMPLVVPQLKTLTRGHRADFVDGTAFGAGEFYLTVGAFSDVAPWRSDYVGQQVYYQSVRQVKEDFLTIRDYLWRWDTDWFWCSRPFGVQKPMVRRFWPRRYRRSDVYRKLVALDRAYNLSGRIDARRGLPAREAAIQDVEIPVA